VPMLSSQWVTAGVRPPHSATDNGNSYKDDGTEPQHSSRSSMKGDMRLLAALDPWTEGQCPTPVCNIHSCVRMEDRPPAECALPLRRDYPTDEAAMANTSGITRLMRLQWPTPTGLPDR
jgi:hypothetical protein